MKVTWGDSVRVSASAPDELRPGSPAEVVGVTRAETSVLAARFRVPVGTEVYTVEFSDGSSLEIPEDLLEHTDVPDKQPS